MHSRIISTFSSCKQADAQVVQANEQTRQALAQSENWIESILFSLAKSSKMLSK
ncbi:hypothetical protein J537_0643 [Acinetobacter baumannii 1437282]|nr:hypothetical protein J537_0643 [Acinetobacter baumannii 1437282]